MGVCDAELIRWVFCAVFTDSNYKRHMQIDQVYRVFDQTTQRDTRWAAAQAVGRKIPGTYLQTIFINSSSDRKSIPVACNYSHADSLKKLLFIFHQGCGRAEVDRT